MGVLVTTFAGTGRVSPVDVFENAQDIAAVSRRGEVWSSTSLQGTRLRRQSAMKTGSWTWIGNSLR